MNTMVLSLSSLVTTEATASVTGLCDRFETDATGVHLVGGNTDNAAAIATSFETGMPLAAGAKQTRPDYLYLHGTGIPTTAAVTITTGEGGPFAQGSPMIHGRATRFALGRGIRSGYMKVAVSMNVKTPAVIDALSLETTSSTTRRM